MNKFNLFALVIIVFILFILFSCKKEEQPKTVASIGSFEIIEISDTSIVCRTEVINDGNAEIISKGICWSTQKNPRISNGSTNEGAGIENYESIALGLIQTGKYYVRPYVTNTFATAYGESIEFQAKAGDGKKVIDYDGNIYNTVVIGDQTWLTENSYAEHFQNGVDVYTKKQSFANMKSIMANGIEEIGFKGANEENYYGYTYTWEKVMDARNVCPTGWHSATDTEWRQLMYFIGGLNVAGGKLKEVGVEHWHNPNIGATDQYGFTALPSGYNNSVYVGVYAFWWAATELDSVNAVGWYIKYDEIEAVPIYADKGVGLSVRCIKN